MELWLESEPVWRACGVWGFAPLKVACGTFPRNAPQRGSGVASVDSSQQAGVASPILGTLPLQDPCKTSCRGVCFPLQPALEHFVVAMTKHEAGNFIKRRG